MPRRALRKVDPAIDLSRHLKTWDELPHPWRAAALFEREAPLEVEVGSGKGLFLQSAAAATPEHNFLGIEIAHKYAHYCAARLAKRELSNAVMISGNAERVFRELLPDNALAAVHVYFPDPWWKKRHHKRRVMNPSFLKDVARTLGPSGRFHFWTDVEDYFNASIALIAEHARLSCPLAVAERASAHDLDFRTHFERRTRLSALPVYRAEFEKSAQ
jgi:tRNA (guanine-N7-)-methyltransferase